VSVGATDGGFYVADDGPGAPEHERKKVFDPGYSSTDRGTGLGPGIVGQVADSHGWSVCITDSEDGGGRFEVRNVEAVGYGSSRVEEGFTGSCRRTIAGRGYWNVRPTVSSPSTPASLCLNCCSISS
jgi:hypothetical protein